MRNSLAAASQALSALTVRITSRLRRFLRQPAGNATRRGPKAPRLETRAPQTDREFAEATIRSCRTLW
ncbi:hypothetical protein GCM10027081_41100 [Cupriavidus yeoncheonensis]